MNEDNFSKIVNGQYMQNFVHFWGIMALVSTFFVQSVYNVYTSSGDH